MQRSSESIAALAAALAKAQAQLVNPEKSLVGTVKGGPGEAVERTFRYAPLSSGLDIVRKTLGQHEIATVQTTAIDQTAGIVNLTTVLAHASGEWIASDWPVCAIAETATPRRMGAALTYARRYALFTLVGIAGEDDLDAPDLPAPTPKAAVSEQPKPTPNWPLNGGSHHHAPYQAPGAAQRHDGKSRPKPGVSALEPDTSAQARDRLLVELNALGSGNDAALWAHRCLPEKNRLTAADAERIEEGFRAKLASFAAGSAETADAPIKPEPAATASAPKMRRRQTRSNASGTAIDKSVLTLPEPRRVRDRDHVRYVAKQPCLICGREPSDAHHLRFAQSRALGRKVSDEFTIPLCRGHHREVHRCGDEAAWWRKGGIDPTVTARTLWLETHPIGISTQMDKNDRNWSKRKQSAGGERQNDETKPNLEAGPQ